MFIGSLHIQIPFVQDYTVEPISKPFIFPKNLLAINDFPVQYGPTIPIEAIFFVVIFWRTFIDSSVTSNYPFEST